MGREPSREPGRGPQRRSCIDLDWYLRRQAGVITHGQARAAGMSRHAVQRRLATGRWERLHPGVYLGADREYTEEVRLRAAVLWTGQDAAAHGVSAAWWHGLWSELPRTVEVTVPRRRNPGRRPGIAVRRRDLTNTDVVELREVWVTEVPLTVLEAAVALGPAGSTLLDRALQRRVRFGTVARAHSRNLGRRGSPAASALLTAAADRAASHAERLLVKLLREAGIAGWVLGYAYRDHDIDVAFPAQRLAIEVDGWAWHVSPDRFVRDRQRQNTLVNAGWRVLWFSWHDLTGRPAEVLAKIRDALAAGVITVGRSLTR